MTPSRIQLRRVKGWRKPEGAVVVTRSTIFGNPWAAGTHEAFWGPGQGGGWYSTHRVDAGELTAAQAVDQFRAWMEGRLVDHLPVGLSWFGDIVCRDDLMNRLTLIYDRLPELRGRDLCCWCPLDQPCHADVLLEIANHA
jgi:hypothetical protein